MRSTVCHRKQVKSRILIWSAVVATEDHVLVLTRDRAVAVVHRHAIVIDDDRAHHDAIRFVSQLVTVLKEWNEKCSI